ncbi:FimD/PapC N-terminal domain-containing protein [Providencia sp. PROV149]|uniref:FimD/PapC N-terminal domain-containing protein n=1 Tax=Providencia sp. PROV149 TaxID=2949859 RepID=UPI00234A251D|nr:FimD/PapC N-terminal domain-containing protein [Providencia sp. PROV149]
MMNKNKNLLVIFMLFSSYSHSDSFNLDALDNYHNIHDIENIILNLDHQPAGIYSVDLIVNNVRLLTSNITFKYIEDQLTPIFNKEQLIKIGLNKQTLNQMEFNDNGELTDKLSKIIIGYSYYFNFNHLTLELNIPKHFLDKDEKELNSQDSWSDGITSAFIDYHLLGSHNSNKYI